MRNAATVGAGITQFGGRMMLGGLDRRITLCSVSKPGEVRFGDYPENRAQISGIRFDANYKELGLGEGVAGETQN